MKSFKEITRAMLILTSDCNLRCPYCYEWKKKGVITKEIIKATIDQLAQNAVAMHSNSFGFTLFGGEPTLELDLCKYAINYIAEVGKQYNLSTRCGMTTNGMIFNDEMKELLLLMNEKLDSCGVMFSYDGPPDIETMNRPGVNENFNSGKVMQENISKLKQFIKETPNLKLRFSVHSMISKKTLPHYFKILKYFSDMRLPLRVNFLTEEAWDDNDIEILNEQLKLVYNYFKESNFRKLTYSRLKTDRRMNKVFNCNAGSGIVTVAPNGDLYPCHRIFSTNPEMCYGNILDLDNINIDIVNSFITIKDDDKCRNCNSPFCGVCKQQRLCNACITPTHCRMMAIMKSFRNRVLNYINEHNT